MKKFVLFAALAMSVMSAHAQLSVSQSGNVRIGYKTTTSGLKFVIPDQNATLNLVGTGSNGCGSYITFGDKKKVGIGEETNSFSTDTDKLLLFGTNGISFKADNKSVFSYSPLKLTNPFEFYTDVKANAFLTTSDARMKRDINEISGLGNTLVGITPVSYHLTDGDQAQKASAANAADEDGIVPMPPSDRLQYGFVAQEVREVYPNLVVEDENGYLSIDYLGFIPILVDAYKNLEGVVKEQQEIITNLTNQQNMQRKVPAATKMSIDQEAVLQQNRPNPFREATTISCVVPEGSVEAFICIYDLQGKQVKRIDIDQRGSASVNVDGASLAPGMYIYALIIDGAEVDSKKMILTD